MCKQTTTKRVMLLLEEVIGLIKSLKASNNSRGLQVVVLDASETKLNEIKRLVAPKRTRITKKRKTFFKWFPMFLEKMFWVIVEKVINTTNCYKLLLRKQNLIYENIRKLHHSENTQHGTLVVYAGVLYYCS